MFGLFFTQLGQCFLPGSLAWAWCNPSAGLWPPSISHINHQFLQGLPCLAEASQSLAMLRWPSPWQKSALSVCKKSVNFMSNDSCSPDSSDKIGYASGWTSTWFPVVACGLLLGGAALSTSFFPVPSTWTITCGFKNKMKYLFFRVMAMQTAQDSFSNVITCYAVSYRLPLARHEGCAWLVLGSTSH